MSGPPARPSFTGIGIPGIKKGMLPNRIPRKIPTNIVTMGGSFNLFSVLPSSFSTLLMFSSSPTTITRSPTCKVRLVAPSRSIPERFTRVILTPKSVRRRSDPSVFPLILLWVITIRRETRCFSESFQSSSAGSPIKAVIVSASANADITRSISPFLSIVSD